jgi:hypothetical protein
MSFERARRMLSVAAVAAIAVASVDFAFDSSLLRLLRPKIVDPPIGSSATAPVRIAWEGPRELLVTLEGAGAARELGRRESPFDLEAEHFPRTGQYLVAVRSPILGNLMRAERRFFVLREEPSEEPVQSEAPAPPDAELNEVRASLDEALTRVAELEEQSRALQSRNVHLRQQNRELTATVGELGRLVQESDNDLAAVEIEQEELRRAHEQLMEENRLLRARLQSIPACTTWGYLSYPRYQTIPPVRRVVVASNGRGEVFRDAFECERSRRQDPTAVSSCACVGSAAETALPR